MEEVGQANLLNGSPSEVEIHFHRRRTRFLILILSQDTPARTVRSQFVHATSTCHRQTKFGLLYSWPVASNFGVPVVAVIGS